MKPAKTKKLFFINKSIEFLGRQSLSKVVKASRNSSKTSKQTLCSILEYAKDTEWGKAHNFQQLLENSKSKDFYAKWQEAVSPAEFKDFNSSIKRIKNGEENVLFPGKPKFFTTSPSQKLIPVSSQYYDNYCKIQNMWLYTFLMHKKDCYAGPVAIFDDYSQIEDLKSIFSEDENAAIEIPSANISVVARQEYKDFIKPIFSAPACVYQIEDNDARFYTLVRIAIEQNLHGIIAKDTSVIQKMHALINDSFEDLCDDIERGTVNEKQNVPMEVRSKLTSFFVPNREKARELRELKQKQENILPKHLWPDFKFLSTRKFGDSKDSLQLKELFPPKILYTESSYFTSECKAGLVLNGANDTVLLPHLHFFEFVEESDLKNPKFLQINQLEVGRKYSIYVTTFSGLYRCKLNDLIEVTGFYRTIPTVKFVQKI